MSSKKNSKYQQSHSLNRRMRSMQLESLEPRQMLSAVTFSSENLIESNMFQAVLGNEADSEDTSDRYVILNIATTDGSDFDTANLTITDSSDKEVEIISSKVEGGAASILAKYKLGETYVFEITTDESLTEDPSFNVLFTMAGDVSGGNEVTENDYYTLFGEVNKGLGVNSRFIATYKNIYGVDLSENHYDAIYDVDGNGKITRNTFDTIIAPNYNDKLILTQEITTVPIIKDFEVNGTVPEEVEGQKYTFVTNESKDLTLTGETDAEEMLFTYTTESGTKYSGTIDLTKSGDYKLTSASTTSETITLTYTLNKDGTFSIEFPDGSSSDGSITMELWSDAEHTMDSNTYTLLIDLVAPEMYADDVTIKDAVSFEDVFYIDSKDFTIVVSSSAAEGATLESLKAAMEDKTDGIYIRVYDEKGNEIVKQKLDSSILSEDKDGKLVIADVEAAASLEEGAHTLTVSLTDLAGNVYDSHKVTVKVVVDVTAPVIAVDGYKPDMHYKDEKEYDAMKVEEDSLTLTATATDSGAVDGSTVTITCKQNGETVKAASTTDGKYVFDFTLTDGLNTIVFTAVDSAGNTSTKTCLVYFATELTLSDAGETLQEDGFTQKYSTTESDYKTLDLYSYFNYNAGLTFTASSSNTDLVTTTVGDDGKLSFTYKKTPEEGETLTSKITVTAKNALGETCELTFTLNYVRSAAVEYWTDSAIKDDYAESSLADVEHIISSDKIVFTGTLTVPDGSKGILLNVYEGDETIYSSVDLQKSSTDTDFEYTYDEKTGKFTLTLSNLEDGKYTLRAFDASLDEDLVQNVDVYVNTTAPDVVPAIASSETSVKKNPEFTLTSKGTPNELDSTLGTWAQIYVTKSTETTSTLYAQAKYDTKTNAFGALEYLLKDALKDGTYTFTVQTIDAAGNTTDGNSLTIVIDSAAPTISVPSYVLNYHYNDKTNYDSMLAEDPNFKFEVTVKDAEGSDVTLTCKHNGNAVTGVKSEDGTWTFNYTLQAGINEIIFTAVDAAGNSAAKTCWVYCSAAVSLTDEGNALQENGLKQEYSENQEDYETVDLSKMFNYGNKLSFKVTSSDSSAATVTVSDDGILSFKYPTTPAAGETQTADISIVATDSLKNECTLKFKLTYIRVSEFLTDVTVENDYASKSLADVDHIIAQKTMKITGTLDLPDGASALQMTVMRNAETIYSDVNLLESGTVGDLEYTYDPETGAFSLVLNNSDDGIYNFEVFLPDQAEDTRQKMTVVVDTTVPGVTGTITSPEFTNKNPEITLSQTGTLNDLDQTLGAWIEIYITNSSGTTAPYARTVFDAETKTIGALEYIITSPVADGTYTLSVRTIDAAGNVAELEGSSITVTVDRTLPAVTVTGYTENYNYEDEENFDSMLVKDSALKLTASAKDANLSTFVCTQNGSVVEGTLNEDGSYTFTYTLTEGLNTIVFTATDRAGNTTVKTCKVVFQDVPTLTETGKTLSSTGFVQAASDESADNKTIDLKKLFEYNGTLNYKAESSNTDLVDVAVSSDGILSFTYKSTPKEEEELTSKITVTAENASGKTCSMSFTLTYVSDSQAPKWLNTTLESNVSESSLADVEYILASNKIHFTGTLFDASGIVSAGMNIARNGTTIYENIDLLQNSGADADYIYTYNAETGTFEFLLSGVESGEYVLRIYGKDSKGNQSSIEADDDQKVSVVVDLEAPTITAGMEVVKTGTSDAVVKNNPKFTLSASGTPSTLDAKYGTWAQIYVEAEGGDVLYAQAQYDTKTGAFGELTYIYTDALAEGSWNFRIVTVDAAGNKTETEGSSKEILIDKTAPVIDAGGYDADYDSSDYGTYKREGTNHDSMYLTEDYLEDGKYDLGIVAEDASDVTFVVTIFHSSTGETDTQTETEFVPLEYGLNTVVVTATDAAGNSSSKTYKIYCNDSPTTKDYGAWLESNDFTQLSGAAKKTLKLSDCLTDTKELQFSFENLDEESGDVTVKLLNGVMSFTYRSLEDGEDSYYNSLCVTATDEFGETYEMYFSAVYSLDLYPPEWQNLELVGNPGLTSSVLATNKNDISLTGTLYDLSAIKQAELDVIFNEGKADEVTVIDSLNLLKSSSGTTLNGLKYSYEYVESTWFEGGSFKLQIYKEDGTLVNEGLYTCYIAGKDSAGNDSINDDDTDEQAVEILVDQTAPEVTAGIALIQTGSSTASVNANPTFNVSFSGTSSDTYGTWVEIYRITKTTSLDKDGNTITSEKETLYASGQYKNGACTLKYVSTTLAEGAYEFRVQTVDAAGNVNAPKDRLNVTIDKTIPTFVLFSPTNATIKDGALYTNSAALLVNYTASETDVTMYYSANADRSEAVKYDAEAGAPLVFGSNTLYFWLVDGAGNVGTSTVRTVVVVRNTVPTIVDGAAPLADVTVDFPAESDPTYTLTLSKSALQGKVTDADLESGDKLSYDFLFALPSGADAGIITMKWAEDEAGENYVLTFTFNDYATARSLSTLGTVSFVVKDSYGEAPVDEAGILTFDLKKNTLPVEVVATEISVSQNETASYDFNMNAIFSDPQGNAWKVTSYKIFVNDVEITENVSLSADGQHILWTPTTDTQSAVYGKYGNFVIEAAAANVDEDGNVISGTETAKQKITASIVWSGYSVSQAAADESIALTEGADPFSSAYTEYFTVSNAFDESLAWGNYTVAVSDLKFSVSASGQQVFGWSINEDGSRNSHYSSIFSSAPTISDAGVITFALNTYAYGSASLNFSAGWTQDGVSVSSNTASVSISVANAVAAPHTVVKDADFSIKTGTLEVDFTKDCDGSSDEGSVVFYGWTIDSISAGFEAGFSEDKSYLVIRDADSNSYSYHFSITTSESASNRVTLTRAGVYDSEGKEITDGTFWNNLDGVTLNTTYKIQNSTTEALGSNSCSITFRGLALDLTTSGTRSSSAQEVSADLLKGMNLDSNVWTVTEMKSDTENVTWTDGKFHIAAGWYGTATFTCAIQNSGAGITDSSTITLTIPSANLTPTWKQDVPLTNNQYVWSNSRRSSGVYELDLRNLISDFDASTLEFLLVSSGSGGTVNVSSAGVLTFTADDAAFTTDGLLITVQAKSNAVSSAADASAQFTMKLVITESAAVPEITDVIFDSKNDYLKLDEAGKYVLTLTETTTTSDAASSMQRFEVAVTNADNVLCDTVTILVENTDDADVSLALSGDNLTELLNGLPGVNAYELDASAVSRTSITITATNSVGSGTGAFNVVVSGGVTLVQDESLSPYKNQTFSGTLTEDVYVVESALVSATAGEGSVLTSGTVAAAGSTFTYNAFKGVRSGLKNGTDYTQEDDDDGDTIYTLLKSCTFTTSAEMEAKCSVTIVSIGAGSTLAAGTVLSKSASLKVVDNSDVIAIYKAYSDKGTLLTYNIPSSTFEALGVSVTGMETPKIPSDHAISSIVRNTDGSLTVSYKPYQLLQDRSPIEVTLQLSSGETMTYSIGLNYEQPFSLQYTLASASSSASSVSSLPSSLSKISSEAGTYYLNIWCQCNLPTYSQEFLDTYALCVFSSKTTLYVNKTAASSISVIGGTSSGDLAEHETTWSIDVTNVFFTKETAVLLDGLYYRLGQFVISTTGADDLTFSTTQVLEFGFPFEEIGNTETYIGVSASEITSKQMTIATSDTISRTVAVTSAVAALDVSTLEKTIPVVEELALVPQTAAIVTVNTDEDSVLLPLETGTLETTENDETNAAVESYFEGSESTVGCTTAVASNILDTDLVLQALESSPEIQKAAEALTDAAILESFGDREED